MKKKLTSKKCIALVLAVVMVITSVPLMMVSAVSTGSYDPAPYWGDGSEYSAINTNFIATYNTDGSVDIMFPDAVPQKTYDGSSTKTIEYYIFTLTKITEDGETDAVLWTEKLDADTIRTGSDEYPNHIYYGPGALESLQGYDVQSTYDVAIHAIDSDGWFSDKIHTLLSNVPYYNMTDDFSPNETWVAREMLLFEAAGSAQVEGTAQGNSKENIDYKVYSGTNVNVDGKFVETGYKNSSSYRFWINSAYSGTPFSMQTTWSRSHYNFKNAEEVWFYVDFSRVTINKVAFSLSSNQKTYTTWRDGTEEDASNYGDLFSTKAVAGVNEGTITEGLYIQNADGLWESTSMTGGYFTELSGYEGFVRIPVKYFVLQVDQNLMHYSNTIQEESFGNTLDALESWVNSVSFLDATYDKVILTDTNGTVKGEFTDTISENISYKAANDDDWSQKDVSFINVVVNRAGTPVNEALALQERFQKVTGNFDISIFGSPKRSYEMGTMLNTGASASVSVSGTTATYSIDYGNAPKAIDDLVSAGIEVADWTGESVGKAFDIDQVMFCQYAEGATFNADGTVASTSSVQFPDEGGDFAGDLGKKVAGYYDRTVEVPKAIANYILQYVGEIPSLEDANAIDIIDSIVETYIDCFPGCTTVEQAITYIGTTAGHTEAYNRYTDAKDFIVEYFGLDNETRNQDAVELFEKKVEFLPDPDFADYNSTSLEAQLNDLMALYKSFNLSHFEFLGEDEKDKFITLYNTIIGEEVKTGYSIGAYPFIPFNDFETNYTVGQLSRLFYDNAGLGLDASMNEANTKNLVTWVGNDKLDMAGEIGGTARGWSPLDFRPTASDSKNINPNSTHYARMDAIISDKGFNSSLAATVRLHGELNSLDENWKLATLSTTYLGQNVNSWSELKGLNLSALAITNDSDTGLDSQDATRYGTYTYGGEEIQVLPNSFVMYVDFTDVTDISMNIKFILDDGSGNDVNCYFFGGAEDVYPTIYLLDENGEWEAQSLEITQTDIDASSSLLRDLAPVTCSISASDRNTLEGYKGFIRIPLSHFRIPSYSGIGNVNVDYKILDNILDEGYTIKQAKVTFWDESGANVGKEIQIDAMGFTYDPNCAYRVHTTTKDALVNKLNSDNGLSKDDGTGIKNMDEYFGVKTNDSVEFEKLVAEIDPYEGKEAFLNAYNAAITAHNKLSDYQRSLTEIVHCYNLLTRTEAGKHTIYDLQYESGKNYDTIMATDADWIPKYNDTASLIADITALSDTVKTYDIANSDILDVYDSSDGGQVNYSALGITDEAQVDEIIAIYEEGYYRLSSTNRAALEGTAELTSLENAYNAAKRAKLIQGYIDDMTKFKQSIVAIYTPGTAEPDVRMVKYDEKTTVTTDNGNIEKRVLEIALEDYDDMSVFAKQILTTTDDPAVAGYTNMHAAAEAIYDNSVTINLGTQDGVSGTISGGIILLETNMNNSATTLADKITNRVVLDETFLKEIEYYLGQTESFLPRFAQVDEINVAYHALADQLPVADITSLDASDNALTTIYLNNDDATSATAKIDLTYIATRLNKNVVLYVQSDLTWAQESGTPYESFKYYSYYDTKGSEAGLITAPINNNYTNGNSDSISPYEYVVSVDATEAANVPNGAVYTDTITFFAVDPAVIAEKTADGTDVATVLADSENVLEKVDVTVKFESTNGTEPTSYTVEIPAIPDVQWNNDNPIDVSYTVVNANLGSQKLSVTVSNDGLRNDDDTAFVMTNDDTGTTYTLDYTTQNFGTAEFTGTITTETKPTNQPTMTITGWDKAPYGEYKTTLTYTASVN